MERGIQVKKLSKNLGIFQAVKHLSFTVRKGEIFGIIGPNGAGKTTTLEILEGISEPTEGTVKVLGHVPHKQRRELNKRIGVQFQAGCITLSRCCGGRGRKRRLPNMARKRPF